jgi:septal ring factor EnvC (AmiA/AmiB activator)
MFFRMNNSGSFLFPLDHLSQVTADRDAANLRVAQLEERLAVLEREKAAAKDEAITATRRAEKAEEKERAATQQEEELIPRITAIVNSMNGNFFPLCHDHRLLHLFTDYSFYRFL